VGSFCRQSDCEKFVDVFPELKEELVCPDWYEAVFLKKTGLLQGPVFDPESICSLDDVVRDVTEQISDTPLCGVLQAMEIYKRLVATGLFE